MTNHFYDMINVVKDDMTFNSGCSFLWSLFLWLILPITLATILGWFLADIFTLLTHNWK